jgi:nicotinamide-nucleotide amidase
MLPGPPREMKLMFEQEVLPYLQKFSDRVIVSHDLQLFGIGESSVETILKDLMTSNTNPTLAPYAKEGEVSLRITASAATAEEGYTMMEPMLQEVQALVGQYIYGIDVPDLQTALVSYLLEHHITVSAAESCTGGLISKAITDIPGCSAIYPGGVCSYSNEMKMKWLDVKAETLAAHGAVSAETAIEMAQGIRKATGADFGVSTTGVAGPDGGTPEKPVGLVYVAVAGAGYQHVDELHIAYGKQTTRAMIQQRAAKHALHLLLQTAKQTQQF